MSALIFLLTSIFLATPPAQFVHGVVVDGTTHRPVFGAVVAAPNGKKLATTDRRGSFRVEASELSAIRVSAPHLATKVIALTRTVADAELGRINLWRSGRITVLTPVVPAAPLRWSIARAEPGGVVTGAAREGTVTAARSNLVIDDLEPANYLLVLRGGGPLQQYALPLVLEAGADLVVPVSISPSQVDLEVSRGDRPLGNAAVRFENATLKWSGDVPCDENGKASVELWQTGKFWLFTQSNGIPVEGHIEVLDDQGTGHVDLHLHVPAHAIRGRVIDAANGTPLKDVNVSLEVSGATRAIHSDSAGNFQFEAVPEGRHVLRAYKRGYRFDKPYRVTIASDDTDVDSTIELEAQTGARHVRVLDSGGNPVVGANTFFGFGASVQLLEATDVEGVVTVPPGEGVLFAVPPTGSFAFKTVGAQDAESSTLSVPPGAGLLTITSESTKHEPIPDVLFVLRVNGTLLPPSVVSRLATTQHLPFRTDGDGRAQLTGLPLGLYEIWAVRAREELLAIFGGTAGAPDASVEVAPYPQTVTLTFRAKR